MKIILSKEESTHKKISIAKFLTLGYLITIFVGTLLLMLPIATKTLEPTSFIDSIFTATSATCVTGLIPFDTFTHWSIFGQVVILLLIQIGGLGFMTIVTLIFLLFKKNIGIYNRMVLMQSAGSYGISGIVKLMKRILFGTLIFEGIGATILTCCFWGEMGATSIYYGIFHSVSAFCNAGFDIMGFATGSLTGLYNNWVVLTTLMLLIIVGGLGFVVWSDVLDNRFKFKKFQLHTKIVLVFSLILIVVPALLFFVFESFGAGSSVFESFGFSDKLLSSLFLSVSPRTAGFNTVSIEALTSPSKCLTMVLMFVGGNSGSTAGGLKLTTLIVIIASLISEVKGRENVVIFNRSITGKVVKQAISLLFAYISIVVLACLIIGCFETFAFDDILFETISAIGTVGLSVGVSAGGGVVTKIVLALLMFLGRLGALTLFEWFVKEKKQSALKEAEGKILVG